MKIFSIATLFCLALMLMTAVAFAGSCTGASGVLQRLEAESILDDVAMIHSLDPDLLSAMAHEESGECSDAISPKGAVGLMQLMPGTAREYGVENRFDPAQNALGAARFIDYLKRDRPEGKLTLPEIIAAYNAGEGAVSRAGGIPHYRETEEYVRRVLWRYLIGHVPASERAREAALASPHQSKQAKPAPHLMPGRASRRLDGDKEILDEMADLRRARESSAIGAATQ